MLDKLLEMIDEGVIFKLNKLLKAKNTIQTCTADGVDIAENQEQIKYLTLWSLS